MVRAQELMEYNLTAFQRELMPLGKCHDPCI